MEKFNSYRNILYKIFLIVISIGGIAGICILINFIGILAMTHYKVNKKSLLDS